MRTHRLIRILPAVFLPMLAHTHAFAQQKEEPRPALVVVDEARLDQVEQKRRVTGELRTTRRSLLATEREGLVDRFDVEEGDHLDAGEVVVVLRDPLAQIAVDGAEADARAAEGTLAVEQAVLEDQKLDLARVESLTAKGSATAAELDSASAEVAAGEGRVARAEAELASSRAALDRARRRLEQLTVRSPFAGSIIAKHTELGQWLATGDPVVELIALDSIEAWIDVPERLADRLSDEGVTVDLRIEALDRDITARVTTLVPQIDPLSRLFPVRVTLDNTDGRLKPGMGVVGYVSTGHLEPTLTIHKDAIRRDDAGEFVYYNADGIALPARVTTLFAVGDRLAIRSATIKPGMQIVVEGNERLYPSQPLTIQSDRSDGAGG